MFFRFCNRLRVAVFANSQKIGVCGSLSVSEAKMAYIGKVQGTLELPLAAPTETVLPLKLFPRNYSPPHFHFHFHFHYTHALISWLHSLRCYTYCYTHSVTTLAASFLVSVSRSRIVGRWVGRLFPTWGLRSAVTSNKATVGSPCARPFIFT